MNHNTILIVDDMEVNRAILRSLFEKAYNILEAENGEQALLLINQYQDSIAAVLLDIVMPVKDGYEVLMEMSKGGLINKIPVIVITAEGTSENEVRVFDLGASDIIMKPFEPHVVRRRVQNVIELTTHKLYLEEMVEEQSVKLQESQGVLMDALSSVIEHRSLESGQHVMRIRMFTKVLLTEVMHSYPEYNLDEHKIRIISNASALHDIGKIAIPDAVLNKPGRLTKEEFEIMKTHSLKGCEILAGLEKMHDKEYLQYAYYICRYHHERWDGNGYPDGLKGDDIPIYAQAVGIADAYDALTTERVYKKAYTPDKAYNMILNLECGSFSTRLLECFKAVQEQFVKLTYDYADGAPIKADIDQPMGKPDRASSQEHTLELGQMKYQSLLRFMDCTVLELDYSSGVYHLIYSSTGDFDQLRAGNVFEESYLKFVNQRVHPEDREYALENRRLDSFIESGATKRTFKYRVFHASSGEYTSYEFTALRIHPVLQKILFIWKKHEQPVVTGNGGIAEFDAAIIANSPIGVRQCSNDQQLTIKYINEGFISLLGYSKEEIESEFNNSYIELIHPEDREQMQKMLREQLFSKNTFELEYRMQTKDGRTLHILDKSRTYAGKDGDEYINGAIVDITNQQQSQESLRLSMECHKIIMDQTNDIIFEWDMANDTLSFSSNWIKKFGYEPVSEDISVRIPKASHIMPEDLGVFTKLMNDVKKGELYGEAEIRIADARGRYRWCRLRATTQFDGSGRPIKAIGVILDIDSEKRISQDLMDKAERDSLTGLYNKNAAKQRISSYMEMKKGMAAMLIADIDDFNIVNNTKGHMFGDAVLVEVANRIRRLMGAEDIVSRIGGDEFMVYFPSVESRDYIQKRAEQIIETINSMLREAPYGLDLSCSIGIAFYPDNATGFNELFKCCDKALYYAKQQENNQISCYIPEMMEDVYGEDAMMPMAASTSIESDEAYDKSMKEMVHQIFSILSEARDYEEAILPILEMLGETCGVSRAYIFENSEDGTFCRNTFEWSGAIAAAEASAPSCVDYAEPTAYSENFNECGIFYCSDISSLSERHRELFKSMGTKSLLQCAIINDGKFAGFIGLDDCEEQRLWTKKQIDALMFVSELMSTFLLKKRGGGVRAISRKGLGFAEPARQTANR